MISHKSPISGIAAYGGRYVLTAGYDNQVILWDALTRQAVSRVLHDHLANQCSFSADGGYALTSSSDHTARLWTVPNLHLVSVFSEHEDDVEMSVFHPSEALVATASRDHKVRVYDFAGRLLQTFAGHTADVICVAWDQKPDQLISSSDDGTIKRWSLTTGGLVADLDMNGVETDTIALADDGTIYAGNDEGNIIVIAGENRTTIPAHNAGIKRLVFDSQRHLLISVSYDRTLRLWQMQDAQADEPIVSLRQSSLPPEVWPRSCAFEDDEHIVFATFHSTYRRYNWRNDVWETSQISPTQGVNAVVGLEDGIWTVGDAGIVCRDDHEHARTGSLCNFVTPAENLIITGGQLGIMFNARDGRELHQHRSPLNCGATFVRDGVTHVIVGAYTGEGLVFQIVDGKAQHLADLPLHVNAVKGVAVSGDLIFSVAADTSVTWYRASTLEHIATIEHAHDRIANGCAGLGDGHFASISRDLKLRIWTPDREAIVLETPHTHSIKCVAASDDGRIIATGSYNGRIALYDRDAAEWTHVERPTASGISSVSFDATRRRFLASSYDGCVYSVAPRAHA
jgi:WD40 repeat protein